MNFNKYVHKMIRYNGGVYRVLSVQVAGSVLRVRAKPEGEVNGKTTLLTFRCEDDLAIAHQAHIDAIADAARALFYEN